MASMGAYIDGSALALLVIRQKQLNSTFGGNPNIPLDAPYPYSGLQVFGIFLLFVFPVVSTTVCGLRLYSKHLVGGFGWDDWIICLSVVLAITQSSVQFVFVRKSYIGVHHDQMPKHPADQGYFENFLSQVVYNPILSLVKISALIFLLRLGGNRPRLRFCMNGLLWLNVLQIFAICFVVIFQCTPISGAWDISVRGTCIDSGVYSLTLTAINIVTDVLVLTLPLFIFIDLKVNKRVRNALIGVFMLGIITTMMSVVRLYYVYVVFYAMAGDATYSIGYVTSAVETNLAIVTACAPALWPLARRWFPGLFEQLGINRRYYPDIEIGYASHRSNISRATRSSRRSRIFMTIPSWARQKPSGGQGMLATRTIGGTSFAMNSIEDDRDDGGLSGPPRRVLLDRDPHKKRRTHGRPLALSHIRDNSDEEILETYHGLVRQTESSVIYDHETETTLSMYKSTSRATDRSDATTHALL